MYYDRCVCAQYEYLATKGRNVLAVGRRVEHIINALKPKNTLVLKPDQALPLEGQYDYIILRGALGDIDDIQLYLEQLRLLCNSSTRIIIEYYSYLWQYILKFAQILGLKERQPLQNWLTAADVDNFLTLAGFQRVQVVRSILIPVYIPIISAFVNKFLAPLPILNALTLNHFMIARPLLNHNQEFSVSIVVPCRNEKGNIESAIHRTPEFGSHQEFIFVEGHSKDGTYEEVERVIKAYPKKDIKLLRQTGKGKGDAVRLGFLKATGDILMILDADLTTIPEDMPKFYRALKDNKGEFINGCRLVYPMEKEAMRFLNLVANKSFGLFFSWLLGQRFKDTLCGTKVMFRHHYEELARNRVYFGDFDPFGDFDLIFGAVKLNLKVLELPIHYKNRLYGTTQIQRFRHGLLLIRMCCFALKKIKFR